MFQFQNRGLVGQSQLYYPSSQGIVYQQQQQAPLVRMSFSPGVQYAANPYAQNNLVSQKFGAGVQIGSAQQRGLSSISELRPQTARVQYQSGGAYPRVGAPTGQLVQGGAFLQTQRVPITYVQGDGLRRIQGQAQAPVQAPGFFISQKPQFLRGSNIILPAGTPELILFFILFIFLFLPIFSH